MMLLHHILVLVTSKQYSMIFVFIFQLHMTSFMLLLLPKLLQLQKYQTLVDYSNIISEAYPYVRLVGAGKFTTASMLMVSDSYSILLALGVALCISFSNPITSILIPGIRHSTGLKQDCN